MCSSTWHAFASRPVKRKGPQQHLSLAVSQARGGWQAEIQDILATTLQNGATFATLKLCEGEFADRADRTKCLMDLVLHLLSNRVKSLVVPVSEPPGSYARAMSHDKVEASAPTNQMEEEWMHLLDMEDANAVAPVHCAPVRAMQWPDKTLARLLFLAFEQDQFKAESMSGQCMMGFVAGDP